MSDDNSNDSPQKTVYLNINFLFAGVIKGWVETNNLGPASSLVTLSLCLKIARAIDIDKTQTHRANRLLFGLGNIAGTVIALGRTALGSTDNHPATNDTAVYRH